MLPDVTCQTLPRVTFGPRPRRRSERVGKHPRLHQLTLLTPIFATRARIARRAAHPMVHRCGLDDQVWRSRRGSRSQAVRAGSMPAWTPLYRAHRRARWNNARIDGARHGVEAPPKGARMPAMTRKASARISGAQSSTVRSAQQRDPLAIVFPCSARGWPSRLAHGLSARYAPPSPGWRGPRSRAGPRGALTADCERGSKG